MGNTAEMHVFIFITVYYLHIIYLCSMVNKWIVFMLCHYRWAPFQYIFWFSTLSSRKKLNQYIWLLQGQWSILCEQIIQILLLYLYRKIFWLTRSIKNVSLIKKDYFAYFNKLFESELCNRLYFIMISF